MQPKRHACPLLPAPVPACLPGLSVKVFLSCFHIRPLSSLSPSRMLAGTHLGRTILRPLLRAEVGEIANRRAWHSTEKLTPEVRAGPVGGLRIHEIQGCATWHCV